MSEKLNLPNAPSDPDRWKTHFPDDSPASKAFSERGGDRLVKAARAAKAFAYAPYSNSCEGAALLMEGDETIFTGCNVENPASEASICAARNAIFAAIMKGGTRIRALAISPQSSNGTDLSQRLPSNLCRQVIREFGDEQTVVYLDNGPGKNCSVTGDAFGIEQLKPDDSPPKSGS